MRTPSGTSATRLACCKSRSRCPHSQRTVAPGRGPVPGQQPTLPQPGLVAVPLPTPPCEDRAVSLQASCSHGPSEPCEATRIVGGSGYHGRRALRAADPGTAARSFLPRPGETERTVAERLVIRGAREH